MRRPALRAAVLAASLALALPLLASVGPSAVADDPEPTTAKLTLWAPPVVTAHAYRNRAWTDLGLRAVAEGAPFELRSHRPTYDDLIETSWTSESGTVDLPAGSMDDFSGLKRFLSITIDPRKKGADTLQMKRKACLNGYAERRYPEAPSRSPYPVGCWYNPYTLGSVQGIQEGWSTPLLSQGRPLRLGVGTYDVTASITPTYADLFGLSPAEATRSLVLKVVDESHGGHGGHEHRSLARTADPARQAPTGAPGRADEDGPTPDLRSLPAWGISLSKNTNFLRFSATVWNAGDSPLVVDGFRRDGEDVMDAYQYYFDADGNQTGYEEVGALHFDHKDSHQHWHFEDFARYSLLDENHVEAVRSRKEAFCLANTDSVDLTVKDAEWKPENTDLATSCGDQSSLSIREVLAAGWGDTYTQYRAGQSFKIKGLPNGRYYIAVLANPDNRLHEQSTDNNLSLREIRLSGRPGKRKVTVEQVGIIEEEGYGGTG